MKHGPQSWKACHGYGDANFEEGPEDAKALEAKLVGGGKTEKSRVRENLHN